MTPLDFRRERLAIQAYQLGPRPMLDMLLEVSAGNDIDSTLERYARLDPVLIRNLGADRFPCRMWKVT